MDLWGKRGTRRFFSEQHWRQPLLWNREAESSGQRRRVFCASMADVFEKHVDVVPWRERLWSVIDATPCLDWLLLTKRPGCVTDMVPWNDAWPQNVWLGTTVENQHWARRRIPALLNFPSTVRFLSCEPLLGPIDLSEWLGTSGQSGDTARSIDWVIAGGESGPRARPTNPAWIRSVRDQCLAADVPFHFKQWGTWSPAQPGEDGRKWVALGAEVLFRAGKKHAGRQLDGRTWDEVPLPSAI
jgi:protein gp37